MRSFKMATLALFPFIKQYPKLLFKKRPLRCLYPTVKNLVETSEIALTSSLFTGRCILHSVLLDTVKRLQWSPTTGRLWSLIDNLCLQWLWPSFRRRVYNWPIWAKNQSVDWGWKCQNVLLQYSHHSSHKDSSHHLLLLLQSSTATQKFSPSVSNPKNQTTQTPVTCWYKCAMDFWTRQVIFFQS